MSKRRKVQNPRRPPVTKLPDLQATLDASAIVCAASHALHAREDVSGMAPTALRGDTEGLGAANDRLEQAEMQLGRFDLGIGSSHG